MARAAGVSRSTVHRHFATRADLLAAAGVEADPGSRDRVLAAAGDLLARDGLAAMSMDEVAARAGVSRASVYRLFPGKPALFEALVLAYSPFEPMIALVEAAGDRPPQEVVPEIYRLGASIVVPNLGILRSVLMEVTSGSPEAVQGAQRPLLAMIRSLGGYLDRQMSAGRIRRMHPTLAVQALVGPLVFHLLTRPMAARIGALDVPIEAGIDDLGRVALRGLLSPGSGDVDEPGDFR